MKPEVSFVRWMVGALVIYSVILWLLVWFLVTHH